MTKLEISANFDQTRSFSKMLSKINIFEQEQAELVIITPVWQTQPWFPKVLTMLVDSPVLLPQILALLASPTGNSHPLMQRGQICLAVWLVSGKPGKPQAFQSRLPESWKMPEGQGPNPLTIAPGANGLAGVVQGKLVHFKLLWQI